MLHAFVSVLLRGRWPLRYVLVSLHWLHSRVGCFWFSSGSGTVRVWFPWPSLHRLKSRLADPMVWTLYRAEGRFVLICGSELVAAVGTLEDVLASVSRR